jgi:hypothetical protein
VVQVSWVWCQGAGADTIPRRLGRPRRKWEDNIKMNLQELRFWGMDWIELVQDRDRWRALVIAELNLQVP